MRPVPIAQLYIDKQIGRTQTVFAFPSDYAASSKMIIKVFPLHGSNHRVVCASARRVYLFF